MLPLPTTSASEGFSAHPLMSIRRDNILLCHAQGAHYHQKPSQLHCSKCYWVLQTENAADGNKGVHTHSQWNAPTLLSMNVSTMTQNSPLRPLQP